MIFWLTLSGRFILFSNKVILRGMKTIFGLTCQSCLYPSISAHGTTTLTYLKSLKKNEQAKYVIGKAKLNISNL